MPGDDGNSGLGLGFGEVCCRLEGLYHWGKARQQFVSSDSNLFARYLRREGSRTYCLRLCLDAHLTFNNPMTMGS